MINDQFEWILMNFKLKIRINKLIVILLHIIKIDDYIKNILKKYI